MIGVSVMSGCPVRCKFCATGQMKGYRNLTADEIVQQVDFIIDKNSKGNYPANSKEFKINYTRMGEPFLNIDNVKEAIRRISGAYPNTHHYVSTVGIKDSDFSWIKDNITLQISLHSLDEEHRNWLIPYKNKMSIPELGNTRTESNLKTTLNLTLVEEKDFDINEIKIFDLLHGETSRERFDGNVSRKGNTTKRYVNGRSQAPRAALPGCTAWYSFPETRKGHTCQHMALLRSCPGCRKC